MKYDGLRGAAAVCAAIAWAICSSAAPADESAAAGRAMIEADYLKQAEAWQQRPSRGRPPQRPAAASWQDAAGAVDGVKNGRYAFHTAQEANPWWQVDLGKAMEIGRIVVYNRLDYGPGLHNTDNLNVLTSDDGKTWTLRHANKGKHFGGIRPPGPLEVTFELAPPTARFVRLQIPGKAPIFLHLDEVEVYGLDDPKKNIALSRPADQSSTSQWSTVKVAGPARPAAPGAAVGDFRTPDVVARGRALAAELRRLGLDTTPYDKQLDELAARLESAAGEADAEAPRRLYLRARWAVRRLALANPLLDFDELIFVKRFTQETYPDVCLNHMPWVSRPGGDICVLTKPLSPEGGGQSVRALLKGVLGPGHVHGMDLWWDGTRVVFGYARAKGDQPVRGFPGRLGHALRLSEEPTHIYEMNVDGTNLRRLTRGKWSDLDPTYCPNGDIVFVSERCGYSLQCNEYDKDETSTNLYVMKPDGSGLRRISVTKDGDYLPHCLDDGTIAYTRWEYQERGWARIQSIWTIRPDGTWADALFKQHMNEPWALEDTRSIPGSHKLVAIATGHHTLPMGPLCVIDPAVGMNEVPGIRIVTPGLRPPEGGMAGLPVAEGGLQNHSGLCTNPWALSEKFFLVSYSYSNRQTETSGFGLYLVDVLGNQELIHRDPSISSFTPIPLRPRKRPPILPEQIDLTKDYATCAVSSIADGVDGIDPKRIKYLRISQRMAWPYDLTHGGWRYETDAKGRGINWTPARVLGTVPVEPDGSACFRVPADTAVYFQLLDAEQMELRRMRSFISFQPGETRACTGCHESRATASVIQAPPIAHFKGPAELIPAPWGDRPVSFLRDIQPVLDARCTRCHAGLKPAGGLDLTGGLTASHNQAYDAILRARLVAVSNKNDDARITAPLAFGSHRSKLVAVLREAKHAERAKLSRDDWLRLVTWIDLNAPYHDRFINKRPARPDYNLGADRDLPRRLAAAHAKRCAGCHKPADVSVPHWIDLRQPQRSPFLTAPLASRAGGTGTCKDKGEGLPVAADVYKDRDDADYQAVLTIVQDAVKKAWEYPRRDLLSLRPPETVASAGPRP